MNLAVGSLKGCCVRVVECCVYLVRRIVASLVMLLLRKSIRARTTSLRRRSLYLRVVSSLGDWCPNPSLAILTQGDTYVPTRSGRLAAGL